MKTLLVATDFSTASHNAFKYSLELASSLEAKIVLFTAFQPVAIASPETAIIITADELRQTSQASLQQQLRTAGIPVKVPVELRCEEGEAVKAILEEAGKLKADFIITGIKDHGKGFRQFFGSTVTGLAKHSTIPLLVIPEQAPFKQPGRIALANDITIETDAHTLDALTFLGQCFHSKVYILRIIDNRLTEVFELMDRPAKLATLERTLETEYAYYKSKHITEALGDFVHKQQINLLALIPHHHGFMERVFHKSQTKSMIFRSDIPLLILPEQLINL
jgi:nucleotide-binding universal stress UspA family protein